MIEAGHQVYPFTGLDYWTGTTGLENFMSKILKLPHKLKSKAIMIC